jgi:hypothetical protein
VGAAWYNGSCGNSCWRTGYVKSMKRAVELNTDFILRSCPKLLEFQGVKLSILLR